MAIQRTHLQPAPSYALQAHWGQWRNLTFQPCYNTLKILGLGLSLLLLIGLTWRAYKSRISPEVKLPPSHAKPGNNFAACDVYGEEIWKTLDKAVTVTDEDVAAFLDYQKHGKTVIAAHATNVKFFYGNCDASDSEQGCADIGWGCAWRSIQTALSPFSKFYTFQSLYKICRPTLPFSKHDWAEPGDGKEVCDVSQIPCQLYLYRQIVGTAKTPTEHCKKLWSFWEETEPPGLANMILNHFQENQTPIMVDDVTFAWCILGIKITDEEKVILWVADPHKNSRQDGLYFLILDQKTGKKLDCTGKDIDKYGESNGLATSQKMYPDKGWMLLFPQCPKRKN